MNEKQKPVNWGLICDPAIQWLISTDGAVYDYMRQFIEDKVGPVVNIACAPSPRDIERLRADPNGKVEFPCARLEMKKVKHHLTSEPCVKVSCTEADLAKIFEMQMTQRWSRANEHAVQDRALARLGH